MSNKIFSVMLSLQNLKNILPEIVTKIAINYPIAFINSVSFNLNEKVVAACFWNENPNINKPENFTFDYHSNAGCYIFYSSADIVNSNIEISGTDESGKDILVSLPYQHLIRYQLAS